MKNANIFISMIAIFILCNCSFSQTKSETKNLQFTNRITIETNKWYLKQIITPQKEIIKANKTDFILSFDKIKYKLTSKIYCNSCKILYKFQDNKVIISKIVCTEISCGNSNSIIERIIHKEFKGACNTEIDINKNSELTLTCENNNVFILNKL